MKLSVFGLGYVGAVSSACFANDGHDIIGVDVSEQKVAFFNSGKSAIVEDNLEEYVEKAINGKKMEATQDPKYAVANSDLSIICVGTPSQPNGSIDLQYIFKVSEEIAEGIKEKDSFHTVVIRSTVSPGTVNKCGELIEKTSGKKLNKDFGMVSNPEFLREGTAIEDFFYPPYTVVGASCEESEKMMEELYAAIDAPIYNMKIEEAEMIKYANNNFHAVKITFANEIGNICKELGIDGHKVMDLVTKDTKLNLSPYYMKPGFAFGGSCLPKDVRALSYKASSIDVKTPLLSSLISSNEIQVERGLDLVYKTGKKKIGILGFAFKAGTDDLRESPMVTLIETLIGKGFDIKIYDSNVYLAKLLGKNKEYIEEHIPHISGLLLEDMKDVIAHAETIIIGNNSKEFKEIFDLIKPDQTIIDLVRVDSERVSSDNYVGICW